MLKKRQKARGSMSLVACLKKLFLHNEALEYGFVYSYKHLNEVPENSLKEAIKELESKLKNGQATVTDIALLDALAYRLTTIVQAKERYEISDNPQ